MGIKNFNKFIKINCPEAIQYINKEDLYNKKIGIDGNFWLYQIMGSMKSNDIRIYNNNNIDITHLYGLYVRILSILKLGIKPLFVFDGKAPELKYNTINQRIKEKFVSRKKIEDNSFINEKQKRKLIQNSFFINKKEIEDCKILLEKMNIPYIQSLEEADSQLAYLCKKNYIDYIISNDTDILIFGSKNILPFFKSSNKEYKIINKEIIKKKFNLEEEEIIKLGILLGNDYCILENFSEEQKNIFSKKYIKNLKKEIENINFEKFEKIINYYKFPIVKKYNCDYLDFDIKRNINIKKLLL